MTTYTQRKQFNFLSFQNPIISIVMSPLPFLPFSPRVSLGRLSNSISLNFSRGNT